MKLKSITDYNKLTLKDSIILQHRDNFTTYLLYIKYIKTYKLYVYIYIYIYIHT